VYSEEKDNVSKKIFVETYAFAMLWRILGKTILVLCYLNIDTQCACKCGEIFLPSLYVIGIGSKIVRAVETARAAVLLLCDIDGGSMLWNMGNSAVALQLSNRVHRLSIFGVD